MTVRFRGMDVTAQAQVQLQAGERISLVVSELAPQRIVFRVAGANIMPPDMTSLTNADLEPLLRQASLPINQENLAAIRALILNGQPLGPENVSGLVAAARSVGGFSPANLDAIIFLRTRDLPVTPATVALAANILAGTGNPGELLARLETMTRTGGTGTPAPPAAAATNSAAGSSAAPASAQPLPPQVARALDQLVQIFPRLEIGGGSGQPTGSTGTTSPTVVGQSTTPAVAPTNLGTPSGSDASIPSASQSVTPPVATIAASESGATVGTPAAGATAAGSLPEAATYSPGVGNTAPTSPENTPALSPLAGQLARVVEHFGRSLESRIAGGAAPAETTVDIRALISQLQVQVDEIVQGAVGAERETLLTLQATLRELAEGLESNQLLNSAPATRSDSLDYFVFHLPIHTEDGWESGELRLYKRDGEKEIDPENANIHIRLDMRHLGPVDIGVGFQGDSVSCHFQCEQLDTVRLLEGRSSELAGAIDSLGRKVGAIRHSLNRVESPVEAPQRPLAGRIDTVV